MSKFNHLSIYYFSGTGNALAASNWMKDLALSKDIATEIISIDRFDRIEAPRFNENLLIGFFYPTHGFCMPWNMLRFMYKFPKVKNTKVFFVNTRGGVRIWKFHLPGLTGIAHLLAFAFFLLKGMKIAGAHPIDSPHNFISIAPPQNKRGQDAMIPRNKRSLLRFGERILNNKFSYGIKAWISLPIDLALIPITIGYLLMARFLIGKLFYASYKCNNCKICINNCPVHGIEEIFGRPYWTIKCESCMRCINICPHKAIESWGTRLVLSFILVFPLYTLGISLINSALLNHKWLAIIIGYIFGIGFNFILVPIYFIFAWLMSITIINKLFTFTSLSFIWGRFIQPTIKLKDLFIKKQN